MTLGARVRTTRGTLRLDVDLEVEAGRVLAVLGPNGAGKSTLLRTLAGLTPVDEGRIELDGVVLDEPGSRTFLPPEHRPVGVVFQDHLLFPHLDVLDNVGFGLRGRRRERRLLARPWLERVGLGELGEVRPAELSGGQAQRIALARALATAPAVLLLDEPLAALDARTRALVRRDLRRHLTEFGGVTVLVTHDPVDAFALADHVLVLEHGRATQTGTPAEVAARPRSDYVAELVGTNLVSGHAVEGVVTTPAGGRLVTATGFEGPVLAVVPPAAVSLHRTHPEGSPRNVWEGRITALDRHVERVLVRVDATAPAVPVVAAVTPAAVAALELAEGQAVWVSVKATEVEVY